MRRLRRNALPADTVELARYLIGKTLVHVDQTIVSSNQAISTLTPKVGNMLDEGVRVTGMLTEKRVDKVFGAVDSATVGANAR